ncbi:TMEM165/GDT1 family protein [Thermoleptolyngbya oregonensis NK1-22]|uniref:GDT1 family protein n=1 Tax=Thermoleptolyngbya oregonensis NK1-22 TaxID=2547457 RepID=A0AA96Y3M7_9CYAN|nr:TMEM165/GDT1 family protein [Thermoleptolyngbya oregonensis NK1-22]
MDWNLLGLAFVTVFVSELGDKSQLAAIALGSSGKSVRAVFLGTAVALVLASFLGVMLGGGVAQVVPTRWIKAIAAIGFVVMAIRLLLPGAADELPDEPLDGLLDEPLDGNKPA